MISVSGTQLDHATSAGLQQLQSGIDGLLDYETQVARAKASWDQKPTALFGRLKDTLAAMCSGNRRCVYCEDSLADEIEHMRPKDLFPEQAYVWDNYVLACGPCNGPKNNRFAVLAPDDALVDITRKRGAAVQRPVTGRYALIDPRVENPLDLLWLDFRTWRYVANTEDENSVLAKRASYTIDVLGLNKRDDLVRGRKAAFSNFQSRLESWIEHRVNWSEERKTSFIEDVRMERFRGVWARMKRHRQDVPVLVEIGAMFDVAPEALEW